MSTAAADTNTEFVDFWNEILAPKFIRFRHVLVDGLAQHSAAILPGLKISQGDKVLDVGCGFGDTAILFGRRVGETGSVLAVDCCRTFLDLARDDIEKAGAKNVALLESDAQFHPFDSDFDFVFSRFGTMFFENPVAGLRNMRKALKPGGIMTMIVWRQRSDNPWLNLPKEIVGDILPQPGEDARTCGPGPFSMSDPDFVTQILGIAGYDKLDFQRVDAPLIVGNSVQDAIDFQIMLGPAGEIYREAGALAEQ